MRGWEHEHEHGHDEDEDEEWRGIRSSFRRKRRRRRRESLAIYLAAVIGKQNRYVLRTYLAEEMNTGKRHSIGLEKILYVC